MMTVQPHRFGTASAYVAGKTVTSLANTTISPGSAGGFQVRKSGGVAGSWDAAAIAPPISGNSRVRIQFGSGDYRAGLSVNPAGATGPATGANGAYLVWVTGGLVYLLDRFNNQLGTNQGAATGFAWVDYNAGDDKVRFYKSTSSDFGSAALIRTEGPVGAGSSWGFDSILSSAGASFEALFDAA
jgi:hypothetical protein